MAHFSLSGSVACLHISSKIIHSSRQIIHLALLCCYCCCFQFNLLPNTACFLISSVHFVCLQKPKFFQHFEMANLWVRLDLFYVASIFPSLDAHKHTSRDQLCAAFRQLKLFVFSGGFSLGFSYVEI